MYTIVTGDTRIHYSVDEMKRLAKDYMSNCIDYVHLDLPFCASRAYGKACCWRAEIENLTRVRLEEEDLDFKAYLDMYWDYIHKCENEYNEKKMEGDAK